MSETEKVTLGDMPKPPAPMAPPESAPTWDVPVQSVEIPSRGRVYPVDSALHNRETIEIRSMTAKEEDILTSRALLKQGTAISTLLRSCILDKSIDPDEMLVGDRNAVLVAIRASGYGSNYEAEVQCPECDAKFEHEFNLNKRPIKEMQSEPVQEGKNIFSFILPMSKKEVVFKLLTGAEERELSTIQDRIKKAKGAGSVESNVTMRLVFQTLSIGGITDKKEVRNIVENKLLAGDSLAYRKHIEEVSPNLNLMFYVKCPECGEESEVEMPIGITFLWPEVRG